MREQRPMLIHTPLEMYPGVRPLPKDVPERFYQRFGPSGEVLDPSWPRLTTAESRARFPARAEGLSILLINPPIREWSYPNILPIGQAYIASVAVMDGHSVDILDLN